LHPLPGAVSSILVLPHGFRGDWATPRKLTAGLFHALAFAKSLPQHSLVANTWPHFTQQLKEESICSLPFRTDGAFRFLPGARTNEDAVHSASEGVPVRNGFAPASLIPLDPLAFPQSTCTLNPLPLPLSASTASALLCRFVRTTRARWSTPTTGCSHNGSEQLQNCKNRPLLTHSLTHTHHILCFSVCISQCCVAPHDTQSIFANTKARQINQQYQDVSG